MKKYLNLFNQMATRIKIITGLALLIILTYLCCIGLAPLRKLNELDLLTKSDSIFMKEYSKSAFDEPELASLIRQISFKSALLDMSKDDSINLIINLYDSTVCLSINGLIIHKTFIQSFKVDPLLQRIPNIIYNHIFSHPLRILDDDATIVKEPIVIRQAPKDPEEAAINAYQPDTLIQNPAFLWMNLNHNIQILFEQDVNSTKSAKKTRFSFRAQLLSPKIINSLKAFLSFKKQEYFPTISIKMPADDLREIYRALPTHAKVVIFYR